MLKLCVKDWIACWRLWPALLFLLLLSTVWLFSASIALLTGAILVVGWLGISAGLEEKNGTEVLSASLPLTRAAIVRGRYLLAGLMIPAATVFILGGIPLIRLLRPPRIPSTAVRLLTLEGVAAFLVIAAAAAAYALPLYFRLGFGRAAAAFGISLPLIAVAAVGLGKLAAAWGWIRAIPTRSFLRDPALLVLGELARWKTAVGTLVFAVLGTALPAVILWISMRLSILAYRKRDL